MITHARRLLFRTCHPFYHQAVPSLAALVSLHILPIAAIMLYQCFPRGTIMQRRVAAIIRNLADLVFHSQTAGIRQIYTDPGFSSPLSRVTPLKALSGRKLRVVSARSLVSMATAAGTLRACLAWVVQTLFLNSSSLPDHRHLFGSLPTSPPLHEMARLKRNIRLSPVPLAIGIFGLALAACSLHLRNGTVRAAGQVLNAPPLSSPWRLDAARYDGPSPIWE